MVYLKDLFQTADWRAEKHVPVIESVSEVTKGMSIKVTAMVGKEIPHPNTTEHHIAWIELYFLPLGEKFPYQLGRYEFSSHGASINGLNTSTVYTQPEITINFKTDKSGTIYATAYCNIHGLWTNSKELKVI
ncbi:MAG: class II SORL domain-containing protein [Candidatus Omnitrophica bacterium]|nr:class II SORL domain-containing protein [Candidatus Omnitrophota bacterium]MCM8826151.1 class II SORL domain-containing protein [Candidatus Omnitrophota bacterium]